MPNGLSYMDMRPPTDDGLENVPHVTLTSDVIWDPATLDHKLDSSNNFLAAFHDDGYVHDPKFNDNGEYIHTHIGEHVMQAHDGDVDTSPCPDLFVRPVEEDCDDTNILNTLSLTIPISNFNYPNTRFHIMDAAWHSNHSKHAASLQASYGVHKQAMLDAETTLDCLRAILPAIFPLVPIPDEQEIEIPILADNPDPRKHENLDLINF